VDAHGLDFNTYLIGSNREAAVLAGIPLARHLFLGFLLMGALYGVAGVFPSRPQYCRAHADD
jgi:ribose/xylose/arabinose/galactoside ABC-type transport system permease subunit